MNHQSILLTLGDRQYRLVLLQSIDDTFISGDEMAHRARQIDANSGEEDGQYFLDNRTDIPGKLRGEAVMIFPNWRKSDDPNRIAFIAYVGERWIQGWARIHGEWSHVWLVQRLR